MLPAARTASSKLVSGGVADHLVGAAVQQQGDVGAGRLLHLAQHEDAGLGRALPVDVAERLARLVRPDAPELRGARGQQPLLPAQSCLRPSSGWSTHDFRKAMRG